MLTLITKITQGALVLSLIHRAVLCSKEEAFSDSEEIGSHTGPAFEEEGW